MYFNQKYLILILCFFIISCEGYQKPALLNLSKKQRVCSGFEKKNGLPYFWSKDFPINLHLSQNFPDEYKLQVADAIEVWNQNFSKEIFRLNSIKQLGEIAMLDQSSVIYFYKKWPENLNEKQASTVLYSHSNNVIEADVIINGQDYLFSSSEESLSYQIDLRSLLVHELGHILGLSHTEESSSVMNEFLTNGQIRLELSSEDKESIQCMYN